MQVNDYRIVVRDLNLPLGFEHYVIGVERNVNGVWKTQLELNGLATSSSGNISSIGSTLTGHDIKGYSNFYSGEFYGKVLNSSNLTGQESIFKAGLAFLEKNPDGKYKADIDPNSDNVVFTGTEAGILQAVSGMLKAGNGINTKNYPYELPTSPFSYTQNSNRTAFTLVEAGLIATGATADSKTAILDSITRWDAPGSGKSFDLPDSVWNSIKPTATPLMSYAPLYDNPYLYFSAEQLGQLSQTGEIEYTPYKTVTVDGEIIAIFQKASKVVIDGVSYTAGAISEAYEVAIEGLSQFVGTYKSNIHALNGALSTALTKTFADLGALVASGQSIDGTKILQKFAGYAGVKALPLWGQGWVGDEAMTTPSNDNRQMQLLQNVA